MNDPKDITISIENMPDNITINQFNTDNNSEKPSLIEESRLDNLLFHLQGNLKKKFYKKTLKEINIIIQTNYLQGYWHSWKIYILKIKAMLKIIKKKIIKYLILHLENIKIKHHICIIKKYFNLILNELNKFIEEHIDSNTINDGEKIKDLLICYFEFIYLNAFFNKKLGNFLESISYLSLVKTLYKKTEFLVTSDRTILHIERCFILLINMLLSNEDYFSANKYLNLLMDICLKHLILSTKDLSDGIFIGDKKNINKITNKNSNSVLNKYENEFDNGYGDKSTKKVVLNLIFIYFYKGIYYENTGKIRYAIKCYHQSMWFMNNFFHNSLKELSTLIQNIINKSREFIYAINFLEKSIKNYEYRRILTKNQNKNNKFEKEDNNLNIFFDNSSQIKYKRLNNKLSQLDINEIDTVNKFEIKKNIKCLNAKKREGKDKNIFLSNIRLLETYLSEDFRNIIDEMPKINIYDMDYSTREKIQKYLRKIYFEQNQRKLSKAKKDSLFLTNIKEITPDKQNTNRQIYSEREYFSHNNQKKDFLAINKKYKSDSFYKLNTKNKINNILSYKNIGLQSVNSERKKNLFEKKRNKRAFSPKLNKPSFSKEKIALIKKTGKIKIKEFIQKYRKMKLYSYNNLNKIGFENKKLNHFFNKKYSQKRDFIKKLEDRDLNFQKCILKLKNTPRTALSFYNKEVVKQNAEESFEKIMSLSFNYPMNWKESLSPIEIKKVMFFDKLEKTMINSLDKNALVKYKREKNKEKVKKYLSFDQSNLSKKNINDNNQKIINKLEMKMQELKERRINENNNFQKLLIQNRRLLNFKNERNYKYSNNKKCKGINKSA